MQFKFKPFHTVQKLNYPHGAVQQAQDPEVWRRNFDGQLRPFGSVGVSAAAAAASNGAYEYVLPIGDGHSPDTSVGCMACSAVTISNVTIESGNL